jgi:hypothetical protein
VSEPRGTDLCFQASGSVPSYKSTREYSQRQIRTFTLRAPLHKNTVGLLALGKNEGRSSG